MERVTFKALVARGAKAPTRVLLMAALIALPATVPLGIALQQVTGASIFAIILLMGALQLLATYRIAGSMDHGPASGRDSDQRED